MPSPSSLCGDCQSRDVLDRHRPGQTQYCPICQTALLVGDSGTFRIPVGRAANQTVCRQTACLANRRNETSSVSAPQRPLTSRRRRGVHFWAAVLVVNVSILVVLLATWPTRSTTAAPDAGPSEVAAFPASHTPAVAPTSPIDRRLIVQRRSEVVEPAKDAIVAAQIKSGAGELRSSVKPTDTWPFAETPTPTASVASEQVKAETPTTAAAPLDSAKATPTDSIKERPRWDMRGLDDPQFVAKLERIPELLHVDFRAGAEDRSASLTASRAIKALADEIAAANENSVWKDAYIRGLARKRPDLEGLPFLLERACRQHVEDSRQMAKFSVKIHTALTEYERKHQEWAQQMLATSTLATRFDHCLLWQDFDAKRALPTLDQILSAQREPVRLALTRAAAARPSKESAKILIRRALFDTSDEVRAEAVAALARSAKESGKEAPKGSATDEHAAELLAGFRYPISAIAWNAAEALVALNRYDVMPELEKLLREPTADSPVPRPADPQGRSQVREVVRVNHHKNCLLCHAPTSPEQLRRAGETSVPTGPVPNPYEPFGPVYYSSNGDLITATLANASVTYLRQDFSIQMPTDDHGPWPRMQRFDFLVRTRLVSREEAELLPKKTLSETDAGTAIRYALAELSLRRPVLTTVQR